MEEGLLTRQGLWKKNVMPVMPPYHACPDRPLTGKGEVGAADICYPSGKGGRNRRAV